MSRARAKGTAWETKIVDYLRTSGAPQAERRAMNGGRDRGDVAGIPGVVIEAKAEAQYAGKLSGWLTEAETERRNAQAMIGVVWHKRRGRTSAQDGYVTMDGAAFIKLLRLAEYIP